VTDETYPKADRRGTDGPDPKGKCTPSPCISAAEKGVQVTATMHNTQDKHVPVFNTVNNDIFAHDHAPASGTEILIAGTSDMGETGKDKKSVCDGAD
jgi:hypothetical protein